MTNLWRVDAVMFTVLGYPMSFIEFVGTLLNLACVWLVARRNILNWPVGIIAVVLFGILFYQIQLYADLLEQVYYLVTGFYGWWLWGRKSTANKPAAVSRCSKRVWFATGTAVALGTLALASVIQRLDLWWPTYFPVHASYIGLDAFTTVLSFAAQILMAHRKVESWYLWITVDVLGVWLYQAKGVFLVSILYGIFLALAIKGLWNWRRELVGAEPA